MGGRVRWRGGREGHGGNAGENKPRPPDCGQPTPKEPGKKMR